jgi:biopolymer transport protein TolR
MTPYRLRRRRLMSEINVVPYIDVMLVLLVIFMVTAPLFSRGVEVELPKASAGSIPPREPRPLVVTVDRDGNYYLDERRMDAGALARHLRAVMRRAPETPVLVRGDRRVDYGSVVALMALLQEAGAPRVGLVTEPPSRGGGGGGGERQR